MSSQYRLICLSHDPGIEFGPEDWYTPEQAIGAVSLRSGPLNEHRSCDVIIGKYSYPLIEVACPPKGDQRRACNHTNTLWIDQGWLNLLWHARQNDDTTDKIAGYAAHCWPTARLDRLAHLLRTAE